jgi:NAD(P)-dependent dehydrogenase (short-subunit alcohol dehydrogenase family)
MNQRTSGKTMAKLEGKVAVITGATSGMALATAKLFVEEGAYVFITGRRQAQLDDAVKALGRNVTAVQADSANLADLDRLYQTVKKEKGYIDVLFASAGTAGQPQTLGSVTEEQFDVVFNLNARGTLFTVQKLLPLFRDGGSIIMNGSIASVKGFPALGVYAGSKAALWAFARAWLVELKQRRIRVNVLSPGPIDTPPLKKMPPQVRETFLSIIPRGQFGQEREIATAALFLASDDSSFVNGAELCVDGGVSNI